MSIITSAAVRRHLPVMGTVASFHVYDEIGEDEVRAGIAAASAELERLEAMFSTFRPTSEISRVNSGALPLLDCSPEVIDVLDACTWLEHASSGAFSIRHANGIDPAGFVKGWATERASEQLLRQGLQHWSIGVGGDMLMHGHPGDTPRWTIGIADPHRPGQLITTLTIDSGAVATSGTSERGNHLWTASGEAATTFASLTVVGPSLSWADAFATTAFALGDSGLDWVSQFEGYRAFAVTHAGELVNTIQRQHSELIRHRSSSCPQ